MILLLFLHNNSNEILKYLNRPTIGTSKATGTDDGIGAIVLKLATPSVAQHLTYIINQSLDEGVL